MTDIPNQIQGPHPIPPPALQKPPIGVKWRSSTWYITLVVALSVATDALTYCIITPVLPYRLQELGYTSVSTLTAWLFFVYSGAILIFSMPMAFIFHRYPWRRGPMVMAVIVLQGSLVLFILAKPFWAMVVSRFLQGMAATVVWTVGFALICENVPKENVGRQIGFAVSGVSIGTVSAPPIGGALYSTLGWNAPFIFCIIVCALDLFMRLAVVEQKTLPAYDLRSNMSATDTLSQTSPTVTTAPVDTPVTLEDSLHTEKVADIDQITPMPAQSRKVSVSMASGKERAELPASQNDDVTDIANADCSPTLTLNDQLPLGSAPLEKTSIPSSSPILNDQPSAMGSIAGHSERSLSTARKKELSPWRVMYILGSSKRGLSAFSLTIIYGLLMGALDPTITIRIEEQWHKTSFFVGLIYIAACAPSFAAGPLAGHLADKFGAEWITLPSILIEVPWPLLLMLGGSLPGFIVLFTIVQFFMCSWLSLGGMELAHIAQEVEGISEIHQFAAYNVCYALSSAIGSVSGGQLYDKHGWNAVCWFCFACCVAALPAPFFFTGDRPLYSRLMGKLRNRKDDSEKALEVGGTTKSKVAQETSGTSSEGSTSQ